MSFEDFCAAIARGEAPTAGLSSPLRALWQDRSGDWDGAHASAQAADDRSGAWVHAYLHRKEGDLANAGYWYRRAGHPTPPPTVSLEEEWEQIARALLSA